MVFFTCVLVVIVLYYLQADGLIYVTVIAVVAELFNLFMTQTLSKSVAKQTTKKFVKVITNYKNKITVQQKTIKEFEDLQEKSIKKLNDANLKIKEYEKKLTPNGNLKTKDEEAKPTKKDSDGAKKLQKPEASKLSKEKKSTPKEFIDLPSGSKRKKLPI